MRILCGSLFALAIVAAILLVSIDLNTMTFRYIGQQTFGALVALTVGGMFGFMLITGKGFSDRRTSKYY